MESTKPKKKEKKQEQLHDEKWVKDRIASSQYVNNQCKDGKDTEWSWSNLYQAFSHEFYSQFPFDEDMEDQTNKIYSKTTRSFLHKVATLLAISPCVEVI